MKFLFNLITLICMSGFSVEANSQVLIVSTKETTTISQDIYQILTEKLEIPLEIIKRRTSRNCYPEKEDEINYDIVICPKKNGELRFPVYKKTILKNSYKSFL